MYVPDNPSQSLASGLMVSSEMPIIEEMDDDMDELLSQRDYR